MINISSKTISENLVSVIFVGLLFVSCWYYLDQQRLKAEKVKQDAIALQIKADLIIKQYTKDEIILKEKQKLVEQNLKKQSRDKELSNLTLKFIDESASIDRNRECSDDSEHNAKARKAMALLDLIEAKALEYGRKEILNNFVKKQRLDTSMWYGNCKKP